MLAQLEDVPTGVSAAVLSVMPLARWSRVDADRQGEHVCSICLAPFNVGDEYRRLPCAHIFHASEIDTWLTTKNTCPVCKLVVEC